MNLKEHKKLILSLGCIVENADCKGVIVGHHPRFSVGLAQKASDWLIIPMCCYHHLDGPFAHAIHNGLHLFELNYGKEADLLAETIKRLMQLKQLDIHS